MVTLRLKLSGEVSDFPSSVLATLSARVALLAGVHPSAVSAAVTAASVIIAFEVTSTTAQVAALRQSLGDALPTAAAVESAFRAVGVTVVVLEPPSLVISTPAGSSLTPGCTSSTLANDPERYVCMVSQGGFSLHWAVDGSLTRMAAVGVSMAGYVGVGFSSDGAMVGSEAVIGWCSSGAAGTVGAYLLGGKTPTSVTATSTFSVNAPSASCVNGATTIKFTLDARSAPRNFNAEAGFKLIWALSDTPTISDHSRSGTMQLSLTSGGTSVDRSFSAYQWQLIHGVLMLASWGVVLPVGALIPRLFKTRLSNNGLWFKLHRGFQSVGLLVAIAGIVIALTRPEFGAIDTIHGYLGLVVMGIGVLQPANAFFRPHPPKKGEDKSYGRFAWEILHKGSGWCGLVLGFVCIFLAFPLYARASGSSTIEIAGYFAYGAVLIISFCCCVLRALRIASNGRAPRKFSFNSRFMNVVPSGSTVHIHKFDVAPSQATA